MGAAASIVSVVLKSVVEDKLGSGLVKDLIGISIDGISEKGINEITDFINREKSKIDSILSNENMKSMGIPEDNIDYIVAEIKELLSKINITDEVLRQCKYDSMNLSAFLWDKYRECKNDYIECESEIKRCIFAVAEALIKLVRESENFEKDVLIQISNSIDDANMELQKISEYMDSNLGKLNADNQAILEILQIILKQNREEGTKNKDKKQKIKSRTQEYADKWNQNMFLNDFDKRDQKARTNVKLSEVYLEEHLPHYIWYKNNDNEPSTDLKKLLSEYINDKRNRKMLLILGQPGIGKSTLITWIVANLCERIDDILVYRFASDLSNVNWKDGRISNRVLEELGLSHSDLNGKTLIIDGFDEISIESNRRRDILDDLYGDLIYNRAIDNFSLIITCRENYVSQFAILKCKYITLKPWDETQIRSFCNIFQDKTKNSVSMNMIEKLLENKEILGIPLILYMTLALNISIEKEGSIVDIYDKIFSLDGGIYDRCIDNKNFDESHRIGDVKRQIHQISRELAIWMFENNPEEASISQNEYANICNQVMCMMVTENIEMEQDFKIGSYFKLVKHCEGMDTQELSFIHRSIYEYFVVETICDSIENTILDLSEESQERLAANIAGYLKEGRLTNTIKDYIQYKIFKIYNKLNNEKKARFYLWWEEAIRKMMDYGMFYYTGNNIQNYKDIIEKEAQCFINLMEILRLLIATSKQEYIMENADRLQLQKYIRLSLMLPQMGMISLNKMYLADISLSGANLISTDSRKACFNNTDLYRANLSGLSLLGTDLRGANLENANLESAIIDECQVEYLKKGYDLQGINVYIEKTEELITYEEYCKRG